MRSQSRTAPLSGRHPCAKKGVDRSITHLNPSKCLLIRTYFRGTTSDHARLGAENNLVGVGARNLPRNTLLLVAVSERTLGLKSGLNSCTQLSRPAMWLTFGISLRPRTTYEFDHGISTPYSGGHCKHRVFDVPLCRPILN